MSRNLLSKLAVLALTIFSVTCANAAEIKVNSLDNDGSKSLRQAISGAADGDTVLIVATGTINLDRPIAVQRSIRIEGAEGPLQHIISGQGMDQIFTINPGKNVVIARLSLVDGVGSAVSSEGNLTIENSRILNSSTTGDGGGVLQAGGSLVIEKSYFAGNSANGSGGAVAVIGASATIKSTGFGGIVDGSPVGNSTDGSGGAIHFDAAGDTLSITSSTFYLNSSLQGGAINLQNGSGAGTNLTMVDNALISEIVNHAHAAGSSSLSLQNSLLSGSNGPTDNVSGAVSFTGTNLSGSLEDLGLGNPGDFGGTSTTFPILPGSPAIDSGDSSLLTSDARDQRGLARFSDGNGDGGGDVVDLGAFEIQHYLVTATQIRGSATGGVDDEGFGNPFDPSDDADSIASADVFAKLSKTGKSDIGDAIGANNAAGGGAVSFSSRVVPGRLFLKGSALEIRSDVTIYGPGADQLAIDGDGRSSVFIVGEDANAYIFGIAIENGMASSGAGMQIQTTGGVDLTEVSVAENAASLSGGGMSVETGALQLSRSAVINNSAGGSGGGLSGSDVSTIAIDNSTISYNSAGSSGGAIHSTGTVEIESSTLVGNTVPSVQLQSGADGQLWNSILVHGGDSSIGLDDSSLQIENSGFVLSDATEPALPDGNYSVLTGPAVESLSLNGGTTLSHAPVVPGPAINAGETETDFELDQPGNGRLKSGALDIGSVEFQNDSPNIISVDYPSVVECVSMDGTPVIVTVTISEGDGDPVTLFWNVNGIEFIDSVPAGAAMPAMVQRDFVLQFGSNSFSVVAFDGFTYSQTRNFSISVVDSVKPEISVPATITQATDSGLCTANVSFSVSSTDNCSGIAFTKILFGGVEINSPYNFPVGDNLVTVIAEDTAGNEAQASFTVSVVDVTPPVIVAPTIDPVTADTGSCTASVAFAAGVTDDCSGVASIVYTLGGSIITSGHTFPVGENIVTVTATDGAATPNTSTASFTVTVLDKTPPVITSITPDLNVITDPGYCSALVSFEAQAFDSCSGIQSIVYASVDDFGISSTITSPHRFEPGTHVVTATVTDGAGNQNQAFFSVTVTDDFLNCLYNVSWPNALPLELSGATEVDPTSFANIRQFLALTDQARWYKFSVNPGSRVTVILSELVANFDVVVYGDIAAEYQRLLDQFNNPETQDLSLLPIQFAPESFSPESFSPESFSPESFSPESFSPESFSPESFSPESFSPESFSPESFSPESFSPESFSPESFSPESFSPESFSPESFSPESFSPESFSPEFSTPESFSPESFSAAQVSSMVAYSAFPGIASEGVAFNTFTRSGDIYVRVRGFNGSFSTEAPFSLSVVVESEICDGVQGPETFGESTLPEPVAGNFKTLILWDSFRTEGDDAAFAAKLNELANAQLNQLGVINEVDGVVVDVNLEARVYNANLQADANPGCPFAKNLVADEIKAIVDAYRVANPTLEYIVIAGNDDVIPFFRETDEAFLANEANYIPPVRDSNHSQSSLRYGQMLTQDPYGAACVLNLITGPYAYPELVVGRLVESVEDMSSQIDNFIETNGLISPTSGLVTGYDFLDDAAWAVEAEFSAALNSPVDTLIAASTLAPSEGWSASELADIFLGTRHDLVFLAGHFSTGSSLAADYETRLTAAQVLASGADLLNSLIFSIGCHSGYNTVDDHAIAGITKQPDWAQTFGKMGATFIAGTGYQYGDTEFVEYGERLYLEFARQLRTGAGPVSIGKALVSAKRIYLEETPLMRGIHEKTLVQTTLFGLPMMKVDVPGARLADTTSGTDLGISPVPVPPFFDGLDEFGDPLLIPGPGNALGLETADISLTNTLADVPNELSLTVVEDGSTVVAKWFEGAEGIVTSPAEPVRPLEVYGVAVENTLLRGVGFRGGDYTDIQDFLPLTGAPTTEIRGVFGNFFSEVFYPVQPYNLNLLGAVCEGTIGERLNVYPTQFLAYGGTALGGVLRKYSNMDFRLYYNDNTQTFTNDLGDTIIPALAPEPTIARVVSEETADGNSVDFFINVMGSPAAGIHEVWITYTIVNPLSPTGSWVSENLVQDPDDSTLWKLTLPLNGAASEDLRFMVQAASGTGLVALSTNIGHYYRVGIDDLATRAETRISLSTTATIAAYGESIPVSALLEKQNDDGTWSPLADSRVGIRVGTSAIRGITDSSGSVSLLLPLTTRPGNGLLLQAYFQGDREFGPSADGTVIDITRQTTELDFINPPAPGDPVFGSAIVVALQDGIGTPLKERTVFFLAEYGDGTKIGNAVITDFIGRADLSEIFLPPGAATITAYFNDITLPNGDTVLISDELYEPADPVSINVTFDELVLEDSLGWDPQQVDVYYKATGNNKNASTPIYEGASISGDVGFNVPLQPEDLLAGLENPDFITGRVETTLAGEVIASETVVLDTRGNNGSHWTTTSQPGQQVAYVGIHWQDAPRFDSALSESPGPRILTNFIGNSFTEYRYILEHGNNTYTTTFPNGGPVIVVKNGAIQINASTGLTEGDYSIDGNELTIGVKSGLKPGPDVEFRTVYANNSGGGEVIVPVIDGTNYLEEGGRMTIRLSAIQGTPRPASDATPNLFECRFILGSDDGVQVRSIARIGEGQFAIPWTSEEPGYKKFRP